MLFLIFIVIFVKNSFFWLNHSFLRAQTINIMNFSQYTSQIKETLDCFEDFIGAGHSPIASSSPQTPSFKPAIHNRQPSDRVSIDQDINCFMSPYPKYKCFHCFGLQNHLKLQGSAPLCEDCDGSEYINEVHPLASLFGKILQAKLSPLLHTESPSTSHQHITNSQCNNCLLNIQDDENYSCENCNDYRLCQDCYEKNRFLHLEGHSFRKNKAKTVLRMKLPTMKKISQQHESEEGGTLQDQLLCSLCSQIIEECYQMCEDCSSGGSLFLICSNCNETTTHNPAHSLALMTNNRGSKLLSMVHKPSQTPSHSSYLVDMSQSMEYDVDLDNSSLNKQASKTTPDANISTSKCIEDIQTQSIVYIPSLNLEQSCEYIDPSTPPQCQSPSRKIKDRSQTESISFSQNFSINPESNEPFSPPLRKIPQRRTDSLIRIKLDDSLDNLGLGHEIVRPRSNTSNFIIKERSHCQVEEEDYLFNDYQCDICEGYPIRNIRFHCKECEDYDICEECHRERRNEHLHDFQEINGKALQKERQQRALQISYKYSIQSERNSKIIIKTSLFS